MSIISVSFENTELSKLGKSVKRSIEKAGCELSGRQRVFDFVMYLLSEQYKNKPDAFNDDSHEGNQWFRTNIDITMMSHFEMNEMDAFADQQEYENYRIAFAYHITDA